ncbi:NDP-hexose 2,3-dehydratase family protein, partial [Candidatus Kaiserbacteria bacterium]|nr:NDP-hexose 2,3-dehydratase family protein [Candidatus Kaiserbacteria bacterium]
MTKKELLDFIKGDGYAVTKEMEDAAGQLLEIGEAQKQNLGDITAALAWLKEKRGSYDVRTEEIGVNALDKWHADPKTGNISHESGKFF